MRRSLLKPTALPWVPTAARWAFAGFLGMCLMSHADPTTGPVPDGDHVALKFTGGHDTDGRDHGRPVTLIAAALGVPDDVFREAFNHVHPAPAGKEPEPDQVRKNKDALLSRLSKYGVTNDRLDEVSNYYRYRPEGGKLWKTKPAAGFAVVKDGKVLDVVVTDPGAGYTVPPTATAAGVDGGFTVTLKFGTELKNNGSVDAVKFTPAK